MTITCSSGPMPNESRHKLCVCNFGLRSFIEINLFLIHLDAKNGWFSPRFVAFLILMRNPSSLALNNFPLVWLRSDTLAQIANTYLSNTSSISPEKNKILLTTFRLLDSVQEGLFIMSIRSNNYLEMESKTLTKMPWYFALQVHLHQPVSIFFRISGKSKKC